jgi:hypothetical protein
MIPLVTKQEVQTYKQVSDSINTAKFNELVLQAQMVEILPLLGERLYYDVMSNVSNYSDLLDGNTYEFNSITYTNVGLKAVISHYWYAYYSFYGDEISTAFGLREKLNNDVSKQVSTTMKKTMFELNCRYAYNLWLNVEKFLIRTKEPLFNNCTQPKLKNFRISRIG